jgi:restriction system protein
MSDRSPPYPADLTPAVYEKQVVSWLRASEGTLDSFHVRHLKHLSGPGGDYEFDAVAEFTIFKGAQILLLVECKRYSRPVEREKLLALWAKLQDVKAHKAMMFATCGFQSGAIQYASSYGLATIEFVKDSFTFKTRSDSKTDTPPWAHTSVYSGEFLHYDNGGMSRSRIDSQCTEVLSGWLKSK